jgi:hypothetical protein
VFLPYGLVWAGGPAGRAVAHVAVGALRWRAHTAERIAGLVTRLVQRRSRVDRAAVLAEEVAAGASVVAAEPAMEPDEVAAALPEEPLPESLEAVPEDEAVASPAEPAPETVATDPPAQSVPVRRIRAALRRRG